MVKGDPQMWFKNAFKQKLDITVIAFTFWLFLKAGCFIIINDRASLCKVSAKKD